MSLNSISPIDGRYSTKTKSLSKYFSEYALIKYRVRVECEYLIHLHSELTQLKSVEINPNLIKEIYLNFSIDDANRVKEIESTTNHDVKAVEYFIKEKLDLIGLNEIKEFVHFGLTSQDINNTAIPLLIKEWFLENYLPEIENLKSEIKYLGDTWSKITMLARTHGQSASPTRLGKELFVFVERLENQIESIENCKFYSKFGGATGNFNAHHVSYPSINWVDFSNRFISSLGLKRLQFTTQIEHYDGLAQFFDNLKRINTILIDFSRDIWQYISLDYFKQKVIAGEVGSSAMPHKVNPIDFENAEGNLGMANAILSHLSEKLPISRLQRDLTDSTVLRNVGVPMAHITISLQSIQKGLSKLVLNKTAITNDLEKNWSVVSEAIQTILRRENYETPYEALKKLTRGEEIKKENIHQFIDELEVTDEIKSELKEITPHNYSGI
jgi:adenylosuccinate lyase